MRVVSGGAGLLLSHFDCYVSDEIEEILMLSRTEDSLQVNVGSLLRLDGSR